jgi:hypothetical protein
VDVCFYSRWPDMIAKTMNVSVLDCPRKRRWKKKKVRHPRKGLHKLAWHLLTPPQALLLQRIQRGLL